MPEYFKCPRKTCIYAGAARIHPCPHQKAHTAFMDDDSNCCIEDLGECPKCRPATEEEFLVDSL
jgi:hypothetical protein